ncbi:MAG: M15 family metallopeptidase [Ruminococcus sp.]|nr:M15 family metallopeptidase [Ruminococcus sp.]
MDYLILIDKFNPLPEGYEQKLCLSEIQGRLLEAQACCQCKMMLERAKADGVDIKIISAYRTIEYQQRLWKQSVNQKMLEGYSKAQAETEVAKTLAKAGHSEHNAGLAVDFGTEYATDVEDDFYKSKQAKWLCKNAKNYGYILRYPRLKEHITGISYEPWHYRYVGTEAALFIKQSGLCLEEFLHFYSEKYI